MEGFRSVSGQNLLKIEKETGFTHGQLGWIPSLIRESVPGYMKEGRGDRNVFSPKRRRREEDRMEAEDK